VIAYNPISALMNSIKKKGMKGKRDGGMQGVEGVGMGEKGKKGFLEIP
jgi:hypothetical protein